MQAISLNLNQRQLTAPRFSAKRPDPNRHWSEQEPKEPKPLTVRYDTQNGGFTRYVRVGGKLATATGLVAARHYDDVKRFLIHLTRPPKKDDVQ